MIGNMKLKNIALFAVALAIGVCLSYTNVAHAGIVADMFQEPLDDFISLITEDLGNTLALLGVIAAILIAVWQQSLLTGITMIAVIGIIWSTMELFA